MQNLSQKICEMNPDDLIADAQPPCRPGAAVIASNGTEQTLLRGTLMGKDSDGKLYMLGTAKKTGEAYAILANDVTVPADEDLPADIYISGKFNSNKIIVSEGYEITETDRDTLRKYNIELTASMSF